MPRLHHHRVTDQVDETPDWAWTDDADMPSDQEIERQALNHGRRSTDHPDGYPLPLSSQQHDVLVCLSLGLHTDETGDKLGLSVEAVKDSLRQVRRKLEANTREHAVAIAIRRRLIE